MINTNWTLHCSFVSICYKFSSLLFKDILLVMWYLSSMCSSEFVPAMFSSLEFYLPMLVWWWIKCSATFLFDSIDQRIYVVWLHDLWTPGASIWLKCHLHFFNPSRNHHWIEHWKFGLLSKLNNLVRCALWWILSQPEWYLGPCHITTAFFDIYKQPPLIFSFAYDHLCQPLRSLLCQRDLILLAHFFSKGRNALDIIKVGGPWTVDILCSCVSWCVHSQWGATETVCGPLAYQM